VLVIRVALAAVVLALIAAGGAVGHSAANSMSFTDPIGDSGTKPDISGGTVSNDDAGKLTFTVSFANRPTLLPGDVVEIFLDADHAAWTGNEGFEYVLQYSFDTTPATSELQRWDGTEYVTVSTATVSGAYSGGTLTLSLSFRALGDTGMIRFFVYSNSSANEDDTDFDDAPSEAVFSYQVTIPLLLDAFKPPATVKAGRAATASMLVTTDDEAHGVLACRATISGKAVRGQPTWLAVRVVPQPPPDQSDRVPFAYKGVGFCAWKVPKTAKRKLLKGTMTAIKEGLTVSRSFNVRIG
jgi:hypothetical protein